MPNSVMCPALPSPLQSLHNQYWLAAMSGKGHGGWGRSNTWLRWFSFPKVFIVNPIHFSLLLRFSQKHVWFDILGKVLIGNLVFRFTSNMSKSSLASTCSGCFYIIHNCWQIWHLRNEIVWNGWPPVLMSQSVSKDDAVQEMHCLKVLNTKTWTENKK